jgi:hypothetical protein
MQPPCPSSQQKQHGMWCFMYECSDPLPGPDHSHRSQRFATTSILKQNYYTSVVRVEQWIKVRMAGGRGEARRPV